jgi:hypothetical protein
MAMTNPAIVPAFEKLCFMMRALSEREGNVCALRLILGGPNRLSHPVARSNQPVTK